MGKFRKASQLAAKLQSLCVNAQQILAGSQTDKDKMLLQAVLPTHLNAKLQAVAYPGYPVDTSGLGLKFMFNNENAVLMGHIKFHPFKKGAGNCDRDNAGLTTFHVVIEGIKFKRADGVVVQITFGDSIRDTDNSPAYGDNKFYEDGQQRLKIQGIDIEARDIKPRIDIQSQQRKYQRTSYTYPKNHSYKELCSAVPEMSEMGELLTGMIILANKFYQIAMSDSPALFAEDSQDHADQLIELTDAEAAHRVNQNNFQQKIVTQRFRPVVAEPELNLISDRAFPVVGQQPVESEA